MGNVGKQIAVGLLMGLAAMGAASAAVIQLKGGGHVEGRIVTEDDKQIVLDIGAGTITVQKNDIASPARPSGTTTTAATRTEKPNFVLTNESTPQGLRDMLRSLRNLEGQRLDAVQTYQRMTGLQKTSEQDDKKMLQLENQQLAITKELSQSPGRNSSAVKAYNNRVAQLNGIRAEMLELDKKNKKTHADIDQYRRDLSDYTAALFTFVDQVKQRKQEGPGVDDPSTASNFFTAVDFRLRYYLGETRQVQIPYQQNTHSAQVIAKLNGSASGRFVVDTGCTGMTISKELASKLNLTPLERQATATLANGSTVKCQVALLESVEVEGMRVNNIPVMIMPKRPSDETDGLLGMSFLMAFNIRLDPTANTVTLTQFAPR